MKSKYLVTGLFFFILVGVSSPWVLQRLGTFLVVDEEVDEVDAVVAGGFFEKVFVCYKQNRCKKVIVVLHKKPLENWLVLKRVQSENAIRNRARQAGIKEEDFYLLYIKSTNYLHWAKELEKFFEEKKISSVLFLSSYFKTRRHRFYYSLSFFGNKVVVYVQPSEEVPSLNAWWKKSTYANYFLSEYIRMGWYFFNKLLWTSAV